MPQAGIHGILGLSFRKWFPGWEWLWLGLVLGNLFPDLDNIAIAVATVAGSSTEGLHRTFTHSLFTVAAFVIIFYLVSWVTKDQKWGNFGLGFGSGILMHIILDLFLWFNGVELFWPIRFELNFWSWFIMPDWLSKILMTGEFLAFGLFCLLLISIGRKRKSDEEFLPKLRIFAFIQFALFFLFTIAAFVLRQGFLTIYGLMYLVSLLLTIGVTIRMNHTIEAG